MLEEETKLGGELLETSVCEGNGLVGVVHGGIREERLEEIVARGVEENHNALVCRGLVHGVQNRRDLFIIVSSSSHAGSNSHKPPEQVIVQPYGTPHAGERRGLLLRCIEHENVQCEEVLVGVEIGVIVVNFVQRENGERFRVGGKKQGPELLRGLDAAGETHNGTYRYFSVAFSSILAISTEVLK